MGTVNASLGQTVYFDANIIIYAVEGFAVLEDQVKALLGALGSREIVGITSELTLAEVLVKPIRDGKVHLRRTYARFLQTTPAFQVIPIRRDILEGAAALQATTKLKLPDAIHLATSDIANCDSFLTNDLLFKSTARANIKILSEIDLR